MPSNTQGAKQSAPDPVVLKIGSISIKASELENLLNDVPAPNGMKLNAVGKQHLAELYVRTVLLSQLAVSEHMDENPVLHHRLELVREKMLAQAEYEKLRGEMQVSSQEISDYYTAHEADFDTVELREFLIRKRTQDREGKEIGLAPEEAMKAAESIRKALGAGQSPEQVAQDVSSDNVLLIDPKPRTFRRTEMVPALAEACFKTKDHDVTMPVDTPEALLVVWVIRHGHLSQAQVSSGLERRLAETKMDARLDTLRTKVGIWQDKDYFAKGQASGAPEGTSE